MKTINFIFTVILISLYSIVCNAKILIVDNHFPTPVGTYATVQLAHDAAIAGDTLMLTPSDIEYAGITLTKLVNIVGNGWARPSTSLPNTRTSGFTFNQGSAGASLIGCEVNGDVNINTNNILIKKNKCNYIKVNSGYSNISILQNVLISNRVSELRDVSSIICINENTTSVITNNVIINNAGVSQGPYPYFVNYYPFGITIKYPASTIISNNIIKANANPCVLDKMNTSYITQNVINNIVIGGSVSGLIGTKNNLLNSTQLPVTDGNIQNIDMNTVFVDLANNDFHLKPGSPAIGAGYNGTDCGIYGGELGFVDKGVPNLPYIYFLDVPAVANKRDGLNVTVKAKSGN